MSARSATRSGPIDPTLPHSDTRGLGRRKRHAWARALWLALAGLLGCAPLIRPAPFVGARDRVTGASLLGPFDGQVVDVGTGEPIARVTLVGVWSYQSGDGFLRPHGSEMVEVQTDDAGRYRIGAAPFRKRGLTTRLVSFHLVAYKRGYVGWRSDASFDANRRVEFTARHNRVELRKWRDSDSHAEHLLFLAAPIPIQKLTRWERDFANVELYRALTGEGARPTVTAPEPDKLQVLDASKLLTPEEVRRRTGTSETFDVGELTDLARTHFYHGVHLEAIEREDATWDVGYRVWKDPPAGLAPVIETLQATLPDVRPTGDVTPETWVHDGKDVRAVAFVDRERNAAVLLTCGANQCADIDTAIILAKYLHGRLDLLERVNAPEDTQLPDQAEPLPPAQPSAPAGTPEPSDDDTDEPAPTGAGSSPTKVR